MELTQAIGEAWPGGDGADPGARRLLLQHAEDLPGLSGGLEREQREQGQEEKPRGRGTAAPPQPHGALARMAKQVREPTYPAENPPSEPRTG